MAAWARLVAVTCLAGWAAGQAIPAARCPITTGSGGWYRNIANFPLHDAAWNYDLPRVKCLVEQAKVGLAGAPWVPTRVACEGGHPPAANALLRIFHAPPMPLLCTALPSEFRSM